jgi:uncharacterized membrane protein
VNRHDIIDISFRVILFSMIVLGAIVGMLAIIGLSYMQEDRPDVFDDTWLSYDILFWIMNIWPVLILVLTALLFTDQITFKSLFTRKKKNE